MNVVDFTPYQKSLKLARQLLDDVGETFKILKTTKMNLVMKQYVVVRDEITNEVELIGRFENGLGEILKNGKWQTSGVIYSLQTDGLLEEISEAEALKLISKKKVQELMVA